MCRSFFPRASALGVQVTTILFHVITVVIQRKVACYFSMTVGGYIHSMQSNSDVAALFPVEQASYDNNYGNGPVGTL